MRAALGNVGRPAR